MQPVLLPETYAYVTVPGGRSIPANLTPLATFKEPEGWSLLLTEREAIASALPHAFWCRGISLQIQPSLFAVGLLAVIADRLAKAGISINIVSAYHRDYIFVPSIRAEEALGILRRLAAE
jgi:hypothetical protein